LEDTSAGSSFRIYFSIGRLDNDKENAKGQIKMKSAEGGGINFKSQQMIEMIPIMGPDGGASVVAAHLLRSSPHWEIGSTVLPYPIHLANAMVEDMLPLLGAKNSSDVSSEDTEDVDYIEI
jgi:hypothetical protein